MTDHVELDAILIFDSPHKYDGDLARKATFVFPKLKEDAVAIAKLTAMTGWHLRMTLTPFDEDGNPAT